MNFRKKSLRYNETHILILQQQEQISELQQEMRGLEMSKNIK